MVTVYFAVPSECLDRILEKNSHAPKVITALEGIAVVRLLIPVVLMLSGAFDDENEFRGIPYNRLVSDTHFSALNVKQVRFDHLGDMLTTYSWCIDQDRKDVLTQVLTPVLDSTETMDVVIQTIAMMDRWENQVAWGRLHQIKSLIGAL